MKAKLIKIMGLSPRATEAEILAAAARGAEALRAIAEQTEEKEVVAELIRQSCGGLTEKSALAVIRNRGGFAAARKNLCSKN